MRATIRLANGDLVEGEVVAMGDWMPPIVNAGNVNACAPSLGTVWIGNPAAAQPLHSLHPPTAAAPGPAYFAVMNRDL